VVVVEQVVLVHFLQEALLLLLAAVTLAVVEAVDF
jgi:hypothetical protein